jgi:hypothetical protein
LVTGECPTDLRLRWDSVMSRELREQAKDFALRPGVRFSQEYTSLNPPLLRNQALRFVDVLGETVAAVWLPAWGAVQAPRALV